jgi:hypothetical protein
MKPTWLQVERTNGGLAIAGTALAQYGEHPLEEQRNNRKGVLAFAARSWNLRVAQGRQSSG